jgi:hypothetical protein
LVLAVVTVGLLGLGARREAHSDVPMDIVIPGLGSLFWVDAWGLGVEGYRSLLLEAVPTGNPALS